MKSPRGFRNNNPGNIRQSKQRFKGEVVPSKDAAFKQFTDMAHGFRAIMCILRTYMTKYELCNIAKIITRWAPPAENDTQAYISLVEKLTGFHRFKKLQFNMVTICNLSAAIAFVENGEMPNYKEVIAAWHLL